MAISTVVVRTDTRTREAADDIIDTMNIAEVLTMTNVGMIQITRKIITMTYVIMRDRTMMNISVGVNATTGITIKT